MRVLVCDDHRIFAAMLGDLLRAEGHEVEVVDDPALVVERARSDPPDVCVLDVHFPHAAMDGSQATSEVLALAPGTRVLLLTADGRSPAARRALLSGARGLVDKGRSLGEVVRAVARVGRGEVLVEPALVRDTGPSASLTVREQEVLWMLVRGHSTTELARALGISVNTARKHVQRVLEKLGVSSRLEAVSAAAELDLAEPQVVLDLTEPAVPRPTARPRSG